MRMKKIFRSLFTRLQRVPIPFQKDRNFSETTPEQGERLFALHRSCDTLPLEAFIRALCEGDKSGLVISGDPTVEEIDEAWWVIYAHYVDLSQTNDIKYSLMLQNEVVMLDARLKRIDLIVKSLRIQYDLDLIEILRKDYNYRFAFQENNPVGFNRDLEAVIARSQRWDIQLQMKRGELKAYNDAQEGEKPEKVYFTTILIRLSDHAGYRLRIEDMTVAEFAIRKQDYLQYVEQMKKNRHGRKR